MTENAAMVNSVFLTTMHECPIKNFHISAGLFCLVLFHLWVVEETNNKK